MDGLSVDAIDKDDGRALPDPPVTAASGVFAGGILAGPDVRADGAVGNRKEGCAAAIRFGENAGDLWVPETFHLSAVRDVGEPPGRAGGDDLIA